MKFQIIPKQAEIPAFDTKAIKIRRLEYYDFPYEKYEEEEITESLIAKALKDISEGVNLYLFLDSNGEDECLEVNSDGEWISLGFYRDLGDEYTYSYNPAFASTMAQIDTVDFSDKNIYTDLVSGGQSPIPKVAAIEDMEAGIKAVEYFIRTGEFYPGIDWAYEC